MLKEAKTALRVSTEAYDAEIADLLKAGARDLETAGVIIPGTVDITVTETEDPETGETVITSTDSSTLEDPLVKRALITYVRKNFGSPADYDRVSESYEMQKTQLMHADGYTEWGGDRC